MDLSKCGCEKVFSPTICDIMSKWAPRVEREGGRARRTSCAYLLRPSGAGGGPGEVAAGEVVMHCPRDTLRPMRSLPCAARAPGDATPSKACVGRWRWRFSRASPPDLRTVRARVRPSSAVFPRKRGFLPFSRQPRQFQLSALPTESYYR